MMVGLAGKRPEVESWDHILYIYFKKQDPPGDD